MKCAASHIAWRAEEDAAAADLLIQHGFQGVEVAPTRIWSDPLKASAQEIQTYRKFWSDRGLPIVAMQSLLFGHPELTIFGSADVRRQTRQTLAGMIRLGAELGVQVLIFGSPKNRQRLGQSPDAVQSIAVEFFRDLGNLAHTAGVQFCIEPNPVFYDCDFVTTSAEGHELVNAVNQKGFGLHLDAAAMTLAGETPDALSAAGNFFHFHASEKNLAPVGSGTVEHTRFAEVLRDIHYPGWVSIEMRPLEGSNLPHLKSALQLVKSVYGR